jgi:cytochrome bd-type quinol oxidase subunit 2
MQSSQPSLSDLAHTFTGEMSTLIRQEIAQASAELRQNAKHALEGSMLITAGGALAYAGLLSFLVGFILAMERRMPRWIAGACVGIACGVGSILLINAGRMKFLSEQIIPKQTIQSVQQDAAILDEHLSERQPR